MRGTQGIWINHFGYMEVNRAMLTLHWEKDEFGVVKVIGEQFFQPWTVYLFPFMHVWFVQFSDLLVCFWRQIYVRIKCSSFRKLLWTFVLTASPLLCTPSLAHWPAFLHVKHFFLIFLACQFFFLLFPVLLKQAISWVRFCHYFGFTYQGRNSFLFICLYSFSS